MTNKESIMKLIGTMMKLEIIPKPVDFSLFMLFHNDVIGYSERYGIKDEAEPA